MRWFVYVDIDYYPWGEYVEADTPEEAARAANEGTLRDAAVVVAPADAVFEFGATERLHR